MERMPRLVFIYECFLGIFFSKKFRHCMFPLGYEENHGCQRLARAKFGVNTCSALC